MRKLIAGLALVLGLTGCKGGGEKTEQPADEPPAKAEQAKCTKCGTDCACGCGGDAAKCECKS